MACTLSTGYTIPCKNTAGIQEVYIGLYNGTSMGMTIGTASNLNQITAFTGSTQSFYKFKQTIETGSVTNNGNFNPQNGTAYWDQVAEITVSNVNQTLLDQVTVLGQGSWRVLVLDTNGNYFLLGYKNPVDVTGGTGCLGKAFADLNGYTITFTGKEQAPLVQVTSTAALTLITA